MKLRMLAAVCAMVATNAFATPSVTPVDDGIWNFNGNKVKIGTNIDHFVFENSVAGKYFADFAGSSTGNVSFGIDSVMLNGFALPIRAGSDDYSGTNLFRFSLDNVWLDETFTLDITYTALNKKHHSEGKPFGSYNGTVTIAQAVPEPETYALVGAGLGAMCFVARRRKVGQLNP